MTENSGEPRQGRGFCVSGDMKHGVEAMLSHSPAFLLPLHFNFLKGSLAKKMHRTALQVNTSGRGQMTSYTHDSKGSKGNALLAFEATAPHSILAGLCPPLGFHGTDAVPSASSPRPAASSADSRMGGPSGPWGYMGLGFGKTGQSQLYNLSFLSLGR